MRNLKIQKIINVAARNIAVALVSDPGLYIAAPRRDVPGSNPDIHDLIEGIVKSQLEGTMRRGGGYGDGTSIQREAAPEGAVLDFVQGEGWMEQARRRGL